MKLSPVFATLVFGVMLALQSAAVLADEAPLGSDPQARLAQMKARLDLSEAQQAELQPLLEQYATNLKSIRGAYPAEPSRKEKRAMAKAFRDEQSKFKEQLGGVLTPEQMTEWEAMQKEMREKAKERRREQQQ
jgi:hypothetical protein